ncbi:proprotein convertase P-domain-containing protein [Novipirellula artificiosorum]|nr:proprotein convertase P-domain-containing protein [Novipirellula artificiosorum]
MMNKSSCEAGQKELNRLKRFYKSMFPDRHPVSRDTHDRLKLRRSQVTRKVALSLLAGIWLCPTPLVQAQSGLRDSLERLDRNQNGKIEPAEITPLARPYLERITKARRMSLDRPNEIESLQEAARIYYALQNGVAGARVIPSDDSTVRPFGTDSDQPMVPEFGLAEIRYPYTQDDIDEANRTLRRYDRNGDDYIDREEARRGEWTHRDPFEEDYDHDNRLSRLELGQRYARRRLLSSDSDELVQRSRRIGNGIPPSKPDPLERQDASQWWKKGGNDFWLTAALLGRFDSNKNGKLESQEATSLGMPTSQIDIDRDGDLTREELHAFVSVMQEEAGEGSEGIPGWFYELDKNRDQQVSMMEFSTEWSDEKILEFQQIDTNGDGLLTTAEVVQAKSIAGGTYENHTAEVLPPRRTIISEIAVSEDYLIGDLNLRLSITHSNVSFLDAYLTGPDGQWIELFTEVGGGDDNFEETIFDDQSQFPIIKARPPYKGTFLPEGVVKRQPGLSYYTGKSIQGVWQLVIRGTRSERFGMLHSWSLIVKPQADMIDGVALAPLNDGPQPTTGRAPQTDGVRETVQKETTKATEPRPRPTSEKPKLDYQAIGQKMEAAVAAGQMTPEQVRQAWIAIKGRAGEKEKGEKEKGVKKKEDAKKEYGLKKEGGNRKSANSEKAR